MTQVFLISDTHFWHTNIIAYEQRPFSSIEEMNSTLIKNWNRVVKKDDLVIHLGDFSLANREKTAHIFSQLRGTKWLILGNHDRQRSISWWMNIGFKKVFEFPIIYKDFYILSHAPVYINAQMPYLNLHGHIHSKTYKESFYKNVSVECIDYTPIEFGVATKREE